jgi:hypothetical protein
LLGRHESDCADGGAGSGQEFFRRGRGHRGKADTFAGRGHFRETEIENLGVATSRDENVGRLDVAVDNSFGVRRVERVRNLNPQLQHLLKRQRLARNAVLERGAFHEFHRNKGLAVVFADFVDGANVGMIQSGSSLPLTVEPA